MNNEKQHSPTSGFLLKRLKVNIGRWLTAAKVWTYPLHSSKLFYVCATCTTTWASPERPEQFVNVFVTFVCFVNWKLTGVHLLSVCTTNKKCTNKVATTRETKLCDSFGFYRYPLFSFLDVQKHVLAKLVNNKGKKRRIPGSICSSRPSVLRSRPPSPARKLLYRLKPSSRQQSNACRVQEVSLLGCKTL